eukprot:957796-Karenia_brevis.AAC.1
MYRYYGDVKAYFQGHIIEEGKTIGAAGIQRDDQIRVSHRVRGGAVSPWALHINASTHASSSADHVSPPSNPHIRPAVNPKERALWETVGEKKG